MTTPTSPDSVNQAIMAALAEMQSNMTSLATELRQNQATLRDEMTRRHEYLDERINRSRAAEEELRSRPAAGAAMEPLPAGMKMPKLKRIEAKSDKALRQWFRQLKAYLRAYQMSEEDSRSVFFASQHFDGALETWWQSCAESSDDPVTGGFASVEELAQGAYKQFSGRDMADVARDRLDSIRQTGSVRPYANLIRENLVYLPHRTEGDNIHTFRRGLKPGVGQALALKKPTSLAQAIEMALEVEAAQGIRKLAADRKNVHSGASLNALDGESDEDDCLDAEDDSDDDDDRDGGEEDGEDEIVAYADATGPSKATKEKGRKERRCLKCGKKGHFAKECPTRKKSGDQ